MITKKIIGKAFATYQLTPECYIPDAPCFCYRIKGIIFHGTSFETEPFQTGEATCSCRYDSIHGFLLYIRFADGDVFCEATERKARTFADDCIIKMIIMNDQICFESPYAELVYIYSDGICYGKEESNAEPFYHVSNDELPLGENEIKNIIKADPVCNANQKPYMELLIHAVKIPNTVSRYLFIYEILLSMCCNAQSMPSQKETDLFFKSINVKTVFYMRSDQLPYNLSARYDDTSYLSVLRNSIAHASKMTTSEYQALECDIWNHTRILINATVKKILTIM